MLKTLSDTKYIGVDVGVNGAIAMLWRGELILKLMPTFQLNGVGPRILDVNGTAQVIGGFIDYEPKIQLASDLRRPRKTPVVIVIEKQVVYPGSDSKKHLALIMGEGMRQYGVWQGQAAMFGLVGKCQRVIHVEAGEWQSMVCEGFERQEKGRKGSKLRTQAAMQCYFPGQDFHRTNRCPTLHDGFVDAAAIALYGLNVVEGIEK